jgi:hypothetical protein
VAVDNRLYVEPVAGEILQGDIYRNVPSIHLVARPVLVSRHYKDTPKGVLHGVHSEDGPAPKDGYRWQADQGGESVLAKGFMGNVVLLSHDCEIENDPNHQLVAMIRPITQIQESFRADIMAMKHWAAFPLLAQDEAPAMEDCFVDFRWITSLRPEVLREQDRWARLGPVVLDAMRARFWHYLNRAILEPPPA